MNSGWSHLLILVLWGAFHQQGIGQDISFSATKGLAPNQRNELMGKLQFQQIQQGKEYRYFYPHVKGHQFLEQVVPALGTVIYEQVKYERVLLNYDVYNQLVLTTLIRNGLTENIILDKSRIDAFQIGDITYLVIDKSDQLLSNGIYQLAFQGNGKELLVRTTKTIQGNTNRPGELLRKFVPEEAMVLLVDGTSHVISNKKDLLEAFKDQPEVQRKIKSSGLKFNKHRLRASLLLLLGMI